MKHASEAAIRLPDGGLFTGSRHAFAMEKAAGWDTPTPLVNTPSQVSRALTGPASSYVGVR